MEKARPGEEIERGVRVLVVEANPGDRDRVADWLESEQYEVMVCPGPGAPTYTCVGSDRGRCPLADGADAIVLDLRLSSDAAERGARGWELMLLYARMGKPVVVMADDANPVRPLPDRFAGVVARPAERQALVEAVAGVLEGG